MSSARVLVTGACGFTGTYLCPALERHGYEVHRVVHGSERAIDAADCDLTDPVAVRSLVNAIKPNVVFHLAAISFIGHGNVNAFYAVNVVGTSNLLEAVSELGDQVTKVVLASSANVYGQSPDSPVHEDVCPRPVNHYACSKLAMEHIAATWFDRMPVIIARPFNYTGPGQSESFVIPKIVAHFARREPVLELGNVDVSRDFGDVRDVVDAYIALLHSDAVSTIINICTGASVSLRAVIDHLVQLAGHTPEIRVDPALVRANDITTLFGNPDRLNSIIGERNLRPISRTLADMFSESRHRVVRSNH
jgi:GDP-6-deoxy-D-talose 4-dehydrogenase